jgi:hypothetical protein
MERQSHLVDLQRSVWTRRPVHSILSSLLTGFLTVCLSCWLILSLARGQDEAAMQKWGQQFEEQILPLMKSHCLDCHSGDDPSGEFDLSSFVDGPTAIEKPLVWDQVGKRIRLNEMPPPGSSQFSDPEKSQIYRWLDARPEDDKCSKLATDETQAWYKGYVMSRRLTRAEYLNAMRDLSGVQVDPRFEIPSDGAGGMGFDTNGSTLFTSPIHIEQYLAVAADTLHRVLREGEGSMAAPLGQLRQSLWQDSPPVDLLLVKGWIARFARLAWRRPVEAGELDRLVELFEFGSGRAPARVPAEESPLLEGLHHALLGILISPNFLFVVEREAPQGGVQRLNTYELATRLALFLWSSIPDEDLLNAAETGQLDSSDQIRSQVSRMLQDPRSRALGENFGLQWLGLSNFLTQVHPDQQLFPDFTPELAMDLREEVVQTITENFRQDRSLMELVDTDRIWINGRLAKHYGLAFDSTADWRPVVDGEGQRGGLLTMGAVLAHTSYPTRTSPVLRGRWLLEEILGSRVPPPPPNVPALEDSHSANAASLRERLELHRQNPECAACHDRMDPLGFALENFDVLGRWRSDDSGNPIDATGSLPSGESFDGPDGLKQVLRERSEDFQRHFIRKMLGFALGRELTQFDDCVVDDCMTLLQENHLQSRKVIDGIVTSFAFQHRYFKAAE